MPNHANQFDRLKAALASRYRIERELGHGGLATVYLAEDLKHHRKVVAVVHLSCRPPQSRDIVGHRKKEEPPGAEAQPCTGVAGRLGDLRAARTKDRRLHN